ncbi:MAG: IS630 family transposase [Candidatus Aquicultor sp.]
MRKKKYNVMLSAEERIKLENIITKGTEKARKITRARILLKTDSGEFGPGYDDAAVKEALDAGLATIARIRQRFVEEGLDAALSNRPSTRQYERILDGDGEAHLVKLACSNPPDGRESWTLQLLADKLVELNHAESISYETVRRNLKKNELKPWLNKQWVIPPEANAEFVWKMEDILDVYKRPYDEECPVICMDEVNKQLIGEKRLPIAQRPGKVKRYDYEYVRNGTANAFMFFEPLAGCRYTKVTDRRTKKDWAMCIKELSDKKYPQAKKIVLVMDNLNTHTPSALYETFEPVEAKRILDRLEIHYTPKHGSWLNMAEIELSVLTRQCFNQRIGDMHTLSAQLAAWESERNKKGACVNWQFTTDDARIKLKKLYPSIDA